MLFHYQYTFLGFYPGYLKFIFINYMQAHKNFQYNFITGKKLLRIICKRRFVCIKKAAVVIWKMTPMLSPQKLPTSLLEKLCFIIKLYSKIIEFSFSKNTTKVVATPLYNLEPSIYNIGSLHIRTCFITWFIKYTFCFS